MSHFVPSMALLESGIGGAFGTFAFIMGAGGLLYFMMRGKSDPPKAVGEPKKVMSSDPVRSMVFQCPFPKCPICAGASDKMHQDWDGKRKIKWTCGYCGNSSVQELSDDELPR